MRLLNFNAFGANTAAQRLRIDVAGGAKVEAPFHCAATSIRVELSRFWEVKELLGIMCDR
jgi:hypothetical protein